MKKISICVPTTEYKKDGEKYLIDLFKSIDKQTYKNFEVCISDHSIDDSILNICEEFAGKFLIRYFKNKKHRGNGPSNTNSSMEMSEGEIIKIMFQDDFFYSENCLESIVNHFSDTEKTWLVSGCNHYQENYYYNEMHPKWNSDIIRGINTISSPSVLSLKKSVAERFDSNLTMMMDCEYYYNLYSKYGEPIYVNEIHVTNRIHQNQISTQYIQSDDHQTKFKHEVDYCLEKYNLV